VTLRPQLALEIRLSRSGDSCLIEQLAAGHHFGTNPRAEDVQRFGFRQISYHPKGRPGAGSNLFSQKASGMIPPVRADGVVDLYWVERRKLQSGLSGRALDSQLMAATNNESGFSVATRWSVRVGILMPRQLRRAVLPAHARAPMDRTRLSHRAAGISVDGDWLVRRQRRCAHKLLAARETAWLAFSRKVAGARLGFAGWIHKAGRREAP
jgi:hypothetical protein